MIVIGHTRELAFQISKEYARFGKYLPQGESSIFILLGGRWVRVECACPFAHRTILQR